MLMAGQLSNGCHQQGRTRDDSHKNMCDSLVANEEYRSKWHFSRKELETNSPSRKDGIDWMREDQLRAKYCSFIQNLGMELKVPQLTIATAIMFCHRFYVRQSHSKNNWQIVASVCMFLASKVEETPCSLDKVVVVAYKMMHREDSSAAQRIHLKEVFAKQKRLMLIGERLLLATLRFDLNIEHPYKPLVAALKKFKLQNDLMKIAWNFVNDWLRTTLCLQYKPHYIAAGSLYLAAKVNDVELPSQRGSVWWQEFDVMPRQLQEVVQHMMQQIGFKRTSAAPCTQGKATASPLPIKEDRTRSTPLACAQGKTTDTPLSDKEASSPDSVLSQGGSDSLSPPIKQLPGDGSNQNGTSGPLKACGNIVNKKVESQSQQFEGPNGMVDCSEDVSGSVVNASSAETRRATSNEAVTTIVGLDKLDRERIRAKLKRRRWERENKQATVTDDSVEDSWVREIESGIELGTPNKRVAKPDC